MSETTGMKYARETGAGASGEVPPGMEAAWPGDGGRASRRPAGPGAQKAGVGWGG